MGTLKSIGIGIVAVVGGFFVIFTIIVVVMSVGAGTTIPESQSNDTAVGAGTFDSPIKKEGKVKVTTYSDVLIFDVKDAIQTDRLITVYVTVENQGDHITNRFSYQFRLIDKEHNLYQPQFGGFDMQEIAPRGSDTFRMVFAVASGVDVSECKLVVETGFNDLIYMNVL